MTAWTWNPQTGGDERKLVVSFTSRSEAVGERDQYAEVLVKAGMADTFGVSVACARLSPYCEWGVYVWRYLNARDDY